MADLRLLGIGPANDGWRDSGEARTEYVLIQRTLDRIFAFCGLTIDDVVNSPIAKRQVLGYFKLHREVDRTCEVIDLERQWTGNTRIGRRH